MSSPAPRPLGPYTPVVRAGDWIIVSGQVGIKDGALVEGGVRGQTVQAVENVRQQLATVGATLADIAKTLCFLTDMDTFATFNEAYVDGFAGARPARSTIGVAALPFGAVVEIEAWAHKPSAVAAAAKKPAAKSPKKPAVTKIGKKSSRSASKARR